MEVMHTIMLPVMEVLMIQFVLHSVVLFRLGVVLMQFQLQVRLMEMVHLQLIVMVSIGMLEVHVKFIHQLKLPQLLLLYLAHNANPETSQLWEKLQELPSLQPPIQYLNTLK